MVSCHKYRLSSTVDALFLADSDESKKNNSISVFIFCFAGIGDTGFKYHKALSLMVVAFLFATVYSYIPEMIKTDIKKAFHTYNPIIWMNYPAFDWLVPMPQMLDYIITDIAVNNKWLYSVLGVITELSKPNTK